MTDPDAPGAATLDRFRAGLDRHGVGVTDATPGALAAAVEGAVEPPAVGAPLPFDGLSLPDSVPTDPTTADLDAARTGVTAARLDVADYGSVALAATPDGTEPVALFPERHVVVLRASDVVPGLSEALADLAERAGRDAASHVIATGPSATADMGGLVYGAHGPETVHLVLVGDEEGGRRPAAESGGRLATGAGRRRSVSRDDRAAEIRRLMATEGDAATPYDRPPSSAANY